MQSVYEDVARDTNRWEGAFSAHCMLSGSKSLTCLFARPFKIDIETLVLFPFICEEKVNCSRFMEFVVVLCRPRLEKKIEVCGILF